MKIFIVLTILVLFLGCMNEPAKTDLLKTLDSLNIHANDKIHSVAKLPVNFREFSGKEYLLLENPVFRNRLKQLIPSQPDYDEVVMNMVSVNPVIYMGKYVVITGFAMNENVGYESVVVLDTLENRACAATTDEGGDPYKIFSDYPESEYPDVFREWIGSRQ